MTGNTVGLDANTVGYDDVTRLYDDVTRLYDDVTRRKPLSADLLHPPAACETER